MVVGDDFPLGRLRFADEGEEDGGIEGQAAVEVFGVGFGVAVVGEVVLDGFFELDFAVVDHYESLGMAFLGSGDITAKAALEFEKGVTSRHSL